MRVLTRVQILSALIIIMGLFSPSSARAVAAGTCGAWCTSSCPSHPENICVMSGCKPSGASCIIGPAACQPTYAYALVCDDET